MCDAVSRRWMCGRRRGGEREAQASTRRGGGGGQRQGGRAVVMQRASQAPGGYQALAVLAFPPVVGSVSTEIGLSVGSRWVIGPLVANQARQQRRI